MRHHLFSPQKDVPRYRVALLVKAAAFNKNVIEQNYVFPLLQAGIPAEDIIAFTLEYDENDKAPVGHIKAYLHQLLPVLDSLGVTHLYVADANYFKPLAKQTRAEPHFGYVLPCQFPGYEHFKLVLGLNHQALIYDPQQQPKLDLSINTLMAALQGNYSALGADIIHTAGYPKTYAGIAHALQQLHQYPELTCDIEAFSLKHWLAGVGTIAFAWDKHNGIAFACDYVSLPEKNAEGEYGRYQPNPAIRVLLREFFETYQGRLTFHNATYDCKVLVYTLWMKGLGDTESLLQGLEVMTRRTDDTKLIAYLATNSTAGNTLGLKSLAHEFAGNWAKDDIKDIRRIPLGELTQYNLVDCLSTWYTKSKFYPLMVADNQEAIYKGLFLDSLKLIIQLELTGMPLNAQRIQEVKAELDCMRLTHLAVIEGSPIVQEMNLRVQTKAMNDANAKLKTKQHPLSKFSDLTFNPGSPLQLQVLLYDLMGLPVIDLTDTKQPAAGADTLDKLIHHAKDAHQKALLQALIDHSKVTKILNTFIPAFEGAVAKAEDGIVWLFGSFNLGGTVSGRLSSSDPNLQNIPAGSTFGKLIKSLFMAPVGWLFCGADFNALEDRVNTLLTRDPNKLKVFTQGYDSHCLRAYYFFPEKLQGITETVESINSIKKLFPEIRQLAKSPAFALQYAGTWITLHKTLGFSEVDAKRIEAGFGELYKISAQWVANKIKDAARKGYAELAFGLRLRTPLLAQVLWGGEARVPAAAEAEARTLGNAISGQSYGLLNNRAANEFMKRVWASPYRLDILPMAQIHDAQYYLVRDDIEVMHWFNENLPKCMAWQDLPELQHPDVHLGAEVDVHYCGWHQPITLPNGASREQIKEICKAGAKKYDEKLQA